MDKYVNIVENTLIIWVKGRRAQHFVKNFMKLPEMTKKDNLNIH